MTILLDVHPAVYQPHHMRRPFTIATLCFILLTVVGVKGASTHSEANVPVEISFTSTKAHADPFNTVQLDVRFTDPRGAIKLVPAFWDGTNTWKVRYASPLTGDHQWRSECNDTSDAGLNGVTGKLEIVHYRGTNPLFQHGPIQVAADKRHFEHIDGTRFLWLGDTWWMGLCHRLHFPDEFQQLAADRKQKGFNVIQMVAGLYPDMHPFDPRGANEAGFPWETNYTSIRPQYFDAADQRLRYLIDQGFTPCIVGAWGYFLPWMGQQKAKQHWRELIARYGSWPVVWCIAGEDNLPWYLAKGFPYDDRELVHGWTEVARYVRATDPFHRLTTIHPTGMGTLNSRSAIDDASLIDFDMLQTPHGEMNAVAPTIASFDHAYGLPKMPVLDGEASYEMLNGQIPAEWPRAMFWLCMSKGAPGHTYGANGIWQCNRRDQPHGASPHGGNYGTIPWDDSMRLPGSQQIGNGKKFLEQFPWEQCVPQSDTVHWDKARALVPGNWIWFAEGDPRVDAPIESRFFRRSFTWDGKSKVKRATLRIAADDKATAWLNGKKIGTVTDWRALRDFNVTKLLRPGQNILAVEAENITAPVTLNPAGLIATLEIASNDGSQTIISDTQWKASKQKISNWQTATFDDTTWTSAKLVAPYGQGPWGNLNEGDTSLVPFALGIKDELRIVYSILPRPLAVAGLRAKTKYQLTEFDTVTGASRKETVTTDKSGTWHSPAPSESHDWVIALELKSGRANKQ
ncbi:MAG: alpha-L-rhamnosidase family protein [Verrucomicrobiales bacterium]|nr:alpha-L-rhamnosidase family protein [Verrucomicrobiales bacterium]